VASLTLFIINLTEKERTWPLGYLLRCADLPFRHDGQ